MSILKSIITRTAVAAALGLSGFSAAYAQLNFEPYTAIATGSWPEAVAIGDINGDGLNDIALITSYYSDPENDYKLFVFLQGPDGQLQAPIKYATQASYTSRAKSVDIGDVNGDGNNDIVLGLDRTLIEVFLQNADGSFASSTFATQDSTVIKIGDLNNDGRLDVAGIGHGTATASVLFQDPDGSLQAPISFDAPHGGFDDLDIGDINDDGKNDLIVMSGQGWYDNVAILTQNEGSFEPVVFYDLGSNALAQGLGVGDVNGDLLNDVIISYGGNRPASNIAIFHQDIGVLTPAVSIASYDIPEPVEVADLTGDGLSDVAILHGGWSKMGVYVQTDGGLSPEQLFTIPYASHYGAQGLALGDINNDGFPDAAIADYNHGLVVLYQDAPGPNQPPVANAGPDQFLELDSIGMVVELDGSGSSDPENDPLNFYWILDVPENSNAVLDNPDSVYPSFIPDVIGEYTALLQLYDGNSYSTDTVTIFIGQENLPPIANAGPDQNLDLSSGPVLVQLDGSGSSDPEGQPLSYYWALSAPAGSNAVLDDYILPNPSFTADVAGVYTVYLEVSDGYNYSETDTLTITAESTNLPPTADAGPDQQLQLEQDPVPVQLDGSGSSDPNNDPLNYLWTMSAPEGSNAELSSPYVVNPSFTPDIAGDYTVYLEVSDGMTSSQVDSAIITVLPIPNLPPIADAGPDQTVKQNKEVILDGSQSRDGESDGRPLASWSWVQIGGAPVVLNNASTPNASFTAPQLKGLKSMIQTFELTVTDDEGAEATDRVQITVVK
ncbi:MAG: PKD domain-containing protein [Gammaproteobacteria bacterium]